MALKRDRGDGNNFFQVDGDHNTYSAETPSYESSVASEQQPPVFDRSGGRVPPHSMEGEQSVIGGVLLDNEALNSVLEVLEPADFYVKAHQVIFEAMVTLTDRLEPIDVVTLTQELKKSGRLDAVGGIEYLSRLVDIVPTAANTQYYARIIREMAIRRRLIHEVTEIAQEAFSSGSDLDTFIDSVEQKIFKVSDARIHPSFMKVSEVVKWSIKEVERLSMLKDPITGVPSGFTDLDRMTAGFQPSDLIIIAGRPSMGKTSLVLAIARHVGIEFGKPVAVFSLEMSKEQIVMRMLCSESRVSSSKVRSGKLAENDFPKLVDAAAKLAQADIYIDDTAAISVLEMRAKARRLHREKPLGLIVVDYLQLMRGSTRRSERREQEISEISGALKALAKELHVPVIALSQLNRGVENRQDKRPIMADLRESGAIEQDADIIGFVYRDEVYNQDTADKGIAEIIISKHRNGPIGHVRLAFQSEFTSFENLAEGISYDYLGDEIGFGDEELV